MARFLARKTPRATRELSTREPWTIERTLHLLLAAIAIGGWALAYTALTRGADPAQEIARSDKVRTAAR
jgi:hypothetical protein